MRRNRRMPDPGEPLDLAALLESLRAETRPNVVPASYADAMDATEARA